MIRYQPSGFLISTRSVNGVVRWKAIRTPLLLVLADAVYTCGYAGLKNLGVERGIKRVSCRQTTWALVEAKTVKALVLVWGIEPLDHKSLYV